MSITKKVLFYFPKSETEKPIVYRLVKEYDLLVNIFRAKVTPDEEGYLLLDLSGAEENIANACDWIRSLGVQIREEVKGMRWDKERCTSCGNCVTHCPTRALHVADRGSMKIDFDPNQCIECMNCLTMCPFGACSSVF
jgi:ferredoxin